MILTSKKQKYKCEKSIKYALGKEAKWCSEVRIYKEPLIISRHVQQTQKIRKEIKITTINLTNALSKVRVPKINGNNSEFDQKNKTTTTKTHKNKQKQTNKV